MTNPYSTPEETASVIAQKPQTEHDKWLDAQLDRIDPHRHEMGGAGDAPALRQLVREMGVALRFYAARKNWQSPSTGFAAQYDPAPRPIDVDHGQLARTIMGE